MKLYPPRLNSLEDQVIDHTLLMVANADNLHRVRGGESPRAVIGLCGSSIPTWWDTITDPKGITVKYDGRAVLIPWRWVEARALAYSDSPTPATQIQFQQPVQPAQLELQFA